jgi:polysaccharide biosynthesis protein PslG
MRIAIDDRLYLDFVYQVRGGAVKSFYDVLGVHPSGYNNPPDDWVDKQSAGAGNGFKGHGSFYIKRYQQLREVQLKYGDNKPMWFTEVGWSSTSQAVGGYEYGQDNTEEERGRYFGRLLEQIKNEAPYVTGVFVWNLNFRTLVGPGDEKYGFGVIDASGNPLPAYNCAKEFVRNGERITSAGCRP